MVKRLLMWFARIFRWSVAEVRRFFKDPAQWIFDAPGRLNDSLRKWDLNSHRIDKTRWHDLGFLRGYSKTAFWLPLVVLFFLIYGLPRRPHLAFLFDRGWGVLAVFVVALTIHIIICRKAEGRWLPRLQFLLLAGVGLGVYYVLADSEARHINARAYRHMFAWLGAIVLLLAMPINRWLADRWILGWKAIEDEREAVRTIFEDRLSKTNLFVDFKHKPQRRGSRLLRAFSLVPITSPILLVITPAFFAIVVGRDWLWAWVWVTLVPSWVVLAAAHYQERLSAFREIARQIFVRGAPGVVSAIVILLAVLRLVGVDYVTTVLDQSSKWALVGFVVMLYYLLWLYEYWSQRALSEVLLGLLHKPTEAAGDESDETKYPAYVDYPDGDKPPGKGKDGLPDRRLQIHGNGRLIAIEEADDDAKFPTRFYARPALEVFSWIHGQADAAASDQIGDVVKTLEQRARLYRVVTPLLIAGLVGWQGYKIYNQKQDPGIDARVQECWNRPESPECADRKDLPPSFKLQRALEVAERQGQPEVYAVAASGGGTRAAVYTYAVLKALRERDMLDRVVMTSGVSGGSMGLAYYLAHRQELHQHKPRLIGQHENPNDAWSCFRAATRAPYIAAVLAGAGESRFVTGTRLGQLLTEGFDRELFISAGNCRRNPKMTFGEQTDVGFIFNTSLSGAWRADSPISQRCYEDDETEKRDCGSIASRGSRLALSNVASFTSEQVASTYGGWNLDFDYAIVNDPDVRFSQAASVSANFPPIFSNTMVLLRKGSQPGDEETRDDDRYWITDGGAVENRGAISLLLALRSEIGTSDPGAPEPEGCRQPPGKRGPNDGTWIKLIVIEAAGGSEGYSEDRGTPTALGAAKEIADKLIPELARQVDREYCRKTEGKARVKVVYLPMPITVSRAFGTHWQLLASTTLTDPSRWYKPEEELALSGKELLDVIDLLFAEKHGRDKLTFESPKLWASIQRKIGIGEEAAARWNHRVHRHIWRWVGQGADGGADEDPRTRLDRELEP